MYNGIEKINKVIDYIESNLTDNLDCRILAEKMNISVYEFRRIFSFVVGCPISEYIRKRKLSLAALEIMSGEKVDILSISEKYGYANQSAFTRAFCEQHGVSPTTCLKEKAAINLFTRPQFNLTVSGRESISLQIVKTDDFYINGFVGTSNINDTCCCENVWNAFYESGFDKKLNTDTIYVSYSNKDSDVICCIGEKSATGEKIPASKWACFKMNSVDDDVVNEMYSKILYEWLPSANIECNKNIPTIEVYPFDMSEDNFEWEIRIPIK